MTGLIANTELVVCAAETRARHPELFHYTSLDAFEKKWRFIRLERNAAEPVSGPAGPSESLRTCLQSGLPAAPPRSYQHSAQRFRFESPSLRHYAELRTNSLWPAKALRNTLKQTFK